MPSLFEGHRVRSPKFAQSMRVVLDAPGSALTEFFVLLFPRERTRLPHDE